MEIPIARQPGQKTAVDGLIRALKRADVILLRMVAEEIFLDGATAYIAADRPATFGANAAYDLRVPPGGEPAQIVDAMLQRFAESKATCFTCDASESVWPAPLASALESGGFAARRCEVAELVALARPAQVDPAMQVIPGRAAYQELHRLYTSRFAAAGDAQPQATAQVRVDQLDDPRVDLFLARQSRQPVGLAGLLTLGNIGVVLDLLTAPDAQDPAVLPTVASHLIDHCIRAQFEQVIMRLDENDARRGFVESIGFKAVGRYVRYCL